MTLSSGALEIHLTEEHGGCWNVQHFADSDEPANFSPKVAHPSWMAIDVVKSKKAYFYAEPKEGSKKRSYLVQGDAVAVISEKNGWYVVEYEGGKHAIIGYMKKPDLYGLPETSSKL